MNDRRSEKLKQELARTRDKLLRRIYQAEVLPPHVTPGEASTSEQSAIDHLSLVANARTCHLLILNGGARHDVDPKALKDWLARLAGVDTSTIVVDVERDKSWALVTFESAEAAQRCYEAIPRDAKEPVLLDNVPLVEYTTLVRADATRVRAHDLSR
jgi:hypothetical protein